MTKLVPGLRGHHLVCLHFFQGKGYDDRFVENLHGVLASVKQWGTLVLSGADDVCKACPHLNFELCRDEKEIREMDEDAVALLGVTEGKRYDWKILEERVKTIFSPWYRNYCSACAFIDACEQSESFRDLAARVS